MIFSWAESLTPLQKYIYDAPEMTRTSDLRFRNPGYAPVVAWRFVAAQSFLCLTVYCQGI
jgi:hypothetical protein